MRFVEAIKSCYQYYATLSGRSSRSEFWYFNLLFYAPLLILYLGFEYGPLSDNFYLAATGIFVLANFLPMLAVSVRRLHDVNMSGWWLLIRIVPLLGDLYLLIKFCTKGDVGSNRYGDGQSKDITQWGRDDSYTRCECGHFYDKGMCHCPYCVSNAYMLECTSGQYKGCKFPLGGEIFIGTDPSRCSIVLDKGMHPIVETVHCVVREDGGVECLAKNGKVEVYSGGSATPISIKNSDRLYILGSDKSFGFDGLIFNFELKVFQCDDKDKLDPAPVDWFERNLHNQ